MDKKYIDIIGAGISGFATAYFLNEYSDHVKIRVWEKCSQVGGLAGTFKIGHTQIEKFYHHVYRKDLALQDLIKKLGLGDDVVWKEAPLGAYFLNQSFRLSTASDILRFAPLNIIDRLRFMYLMLAARFVKNWGDIDNISAKNFIIKYAGENVYKVMWQPLLYGKFGCYAEKISAAWLWCKLIDRGSRRLGSSEQLGYLRGGLGKVFNEIMDQLQSNGNEVHLNSPIQGFDVNNDNIITKINTGRGTFKTDCVICCSQTPEFSLILPQRFSKYKQRLNAIEFLSNVCLVLVLNERLSEFYWNNIMIENYPFIGIIEHTNWTGVQELEGKHLVYLSAYTTNNDKRLSMTSVELCKHYMPYIQKIFPRFNYSKIEQSYIWSAPYAQPIVKTGYRKLRPPVETPIGNLFLCTMAQIYPQDRQISNGIDMAKKLSKIVADRLQLTT